MIRRYKLLVLIPVLVLVPILLAMTPLNMAHKAENGAPFSQSKHCKCSKAHRPFHSIVSHGDLQTGLLNPSSLDQQLAHSQEFDHSIQDPSRSNILFLSIPLRC